MPENTVPWYRRTQRWGQTNLTENDPARFDLAWWRAHWKRTRVQGVIVNAGGIVAYYPSALPQHRASSLGERDLLGEISAAAREDGLAVVARMDSNRVLEPFFRLHPDWICQDIQGQPYRVREYYVTCVHSPYYQEYVPSILREIAARIRPEGFADNSWSGLGRDSICYCPHCVRGFKDRSGQALPRAKDWDDPVWLEWLAWNKQRRLDLWDLNNRVAREAGGPDCLWAGMARGSLMGQSSGFRDLKGLADRSKVVFLDYQGRDKNTGFSANGDAGRLWHDLAGWDTLIPESMAMYQILPPAFRLSARPEPEAHLWMFEGIAAGIQPWWHHIGSVQEDKRQFETAAPVFQWHEKNQAYLKDRSPLAPVAILWNQENYEFYGRDEAGSLVEEPFQGWAQALVRARIPYRILHVDHLARESAGLQAVILPNLAALTDSQCESLKTFVAGDKGLIASGDSGRYDENGKMRPEFPLRALLGLKLVGAGRLQPEKLSQDWDRHAHHHYFRMDEQGRPEFLAGLEGTGILAFGGALNPVEPSGAAAHLAYVPAFPVFPPESAFPGPSDPARQGIYTQDHPGGGRTAYLAADFDRCFARMKLPDHATLLAGLARWACRGNLPLEVKGAGLLDCHLYRQGPKLILHLVNLGQISNPADQWMPAGPFEVALRPPQGMDVSKARSLVSGLALATEVHAGSILLKLDTIKAHEVLVFE